MIKFMLFILPIMVIRKFLITVLPPKQKNTWITQIQTTDALFP